MKGCGGMGVRVAVGIRKNNKGIRKENNRGNDYSVSLFGLHNNISNINAFHTSLNPGHGCN